MVGAAYYAVIPATVRYDKDIPASAKLLYGEITALATAEGYCWANNAYFMELYGVSDRTVSRWINDLSKKGYISREVIRDDKGEVKERRLYINDISAVLEGSDPPDKNVTTSRQKGADPPDKNVTTSRQNCPNPPDKNVGYNNTSINNTRESARAKTTQIYGELNNVFLTSAELATLNARYGARDVQRTIDRLSCYIASSGKKYKSHYATLLNWLRDDSTGADDQAPEVHTTLADRGADEW